MIPELDHRRIALWVDSRNDRFPRDARDQIRYELDLAANTATIIECRPPWRPEQGPDWTRFPIARPRYTKSRSEWKLMWRDRNLRFHSYSHTAPTASVSDLLEEVDRDPTGIFWG